MMLWIKFYYLRILSSFIVKGSFLPYAWNHSSSLESGHLDAYLLVLRAPATPAMKQSPRSETVLEDAGITNCTLILDEDL